MLRDPHHQIQHPDSVNRHQEVQQQLSRQEQESPDLQVVGCRLDWEGQQQVWADHHLPEDSDSHPEEVSLEEHRRRDSQEEVPVDLQQAALLLASALRLLVSVHHRLDFNHHLVSKVARLAKEEDMVHQASAGEGVII